MTLPELITHAQHHEGLFYEVVLKSSRPVQKWVSNNIKNMMLDHILCSARDDEGFSASVCIRRMLIFIFESFLFF